jgi:hypothetical protein
MVGPSSAAVSPLTSDAHTGSPVKRRHHRRLAGVVAPLHNITGAPTPTAPSRLELLMVEPPGGEVRGDTAPGGAGVRAHVHKLCVILFFCSIVSYRRRAKIMLCQWLISPAYHNFCAPTVLIYRRHIALLIRQG